MTFQYMTLTFTGMLVLWHVIVLYMKMKHVPNPRCMFHVPTMELSNLSSATKGVIQPNEKVLVFYIIVRIRKGNFSIYNIDISVFSDRISSTTFP